MKLTPKQREVILRMGEQPLALYGRGFFWPIPGGTLAGLARRGFIEKVAFDIFGRSSYRWKLTEDGRKLLEEMDDAD